MDTVLDTHANANDRRTDVDGGIVRQLWTHPLGRVFARGDCMLTVLDPTVCPPEPGFGPSLLRRLRALRGPAILGVLDLKQSAGGRVVAETELADASPLAQRLEAGRLEPPRALGILRQVAQALAHAHRMGMSHGALCTSSVLLGVREGRRDAVRVADFGLGCLAWTDHLRDATTTPTSPERTLGLSRGPSEDIYLFGCVAFVVLSGGSVFDGDCAETVRRRHAIEDAPDLRDTAGGRDVPAPIAELVAACLAKDPEDRFADGDELDAALCEAQIEAEIVTAWDDLPSPRVTRDRARAIERALARLWQNETRSEAAASGVFVKPGRGRFALVEPARSPPPPARDAGAPVSAVPRDHTPVVDTDLASVVRRIDEIGVPKPVYDRGDETPVVATAVVTEPVPAATVALPTPPAARASTAPLASSAPVLRHAPAPRRGTRLVMWTSVLAMVAAGGWLAARDRISTPDDTAPTDGDASVASVTSAASVHAESDTPDPAEPDPSVSPSIDDDADPTATPAAPTDDAPPAAAARATRARAKGKASPAPSAPARSVRELVAAAKQAKASGDRNEAERLFTEALARDTDHLGALEELGVLRFNRGDYRGAAKIFGRAVDHAPRNAELRIRLGDAYFKLKQYDNARQQFAKAQDLGHSAAARRLARTDEERSKAL